MALTLLCDYVSTVTVLKMGLKNALWEICCIFKAPQVFKIQGPSSCPKSPIHLNYLKSKLQEIINPNFSLRKNQMVWNRPFQHVALRPHPTGEARPKEWSMIVYKLTKYFPKLYYGINKKGNENKNSREKKKNLGWGMILKIWFVILMLRYSFPSTRPYWKC